MKLNAKVRQAPEGCLQMAVAGLLTVGGLVALLTMIWPSLLLGPRPPRLQASGADSGEQGSLGGHGRLRQFTEHGRVAALFVQMGAYRGGDNTFAVVGLSSRRLHDLGNPWFHCDWAEPGRRSVHGWVLVQKPDWGLGRIYTVLVLNCSFPRPVGTRGRGGSLLLTAGYGNSDNFSRPEEFSALEEAPGEYNPRLYSGQDAPAYDFVFCGSPLYGDLSPQRTREWVAYHARLFGPRSLFVFHDAGGVEGGVRTVLAPWEKLGRVAVENVRNQARYDGYYYNQFLVLNDCLHRARFLARWIFFFDVDEFVAVPSGETLHQLMEDLGNYTQVMIPQQFMSARFCADERKDFDTADEEHWAVEKLVYRAVEPWGRQLDPKYAVQPRNVFATGVHRTENLLGFTKFAEPDRLRYYHFHGSLNNRGPACLEFPSPDPSNSSLFRSSDGAAFEVDYGLARSIPLVKEFELETIGRQPFVP